MVAALLTPGPIVSQIPPASLLGRVFDADSHEGLPDVVVIVEGTGFGTITNAAGLFRFAALPSGDHALVLQHVAYGEVRDSVALSPGQDAKLRITLSQSAIELEALVVQGQSRESNANRARGTQSNVITREMIEPLIATGQGLDQILARHIPGVVVRTPQTRSTTNVCVEFRSPRSLQDPLGCKSPTIFLDGVRLVNAGPIWRNFPVEEIQRLEVVPSVEAGARYGFDSNYGVLLIETRTGQDMLGVETLGAGNRTTYDWGLESEPYPWLKVFASAFVGNALGLAAGAAAGNACFEWEEGLANSHFFLETSCGGLGTFAASAALFGLPVTGATLTTNRVGRTDLSQGRWVPTAIAGLLAVVPGTILVVAKPEESFDGGQLIGWGILTLGVPLFTTIADRLFRNYRESPFDVMTDMRR